MARKNKAHERGHTVTDTRTLSRRVDARRTTTQGRPLEIVRTIEPVKTRQVLRRSVQPVINTRSPYQDVRPSLPSAPVGPAAPVPNQAPLTRPARKVAIINKKQPIKQKLSSLPNPFEPVKQSSTKAREIKVCKERPDAKKAAKSKGGGGAAKFIPWCDRR